MSSERHHFLGSYVRFQSGPGRRRKREPLGTLPLNSEMQGFYNISFVFSLDRLTKAVADDLQQ